MPSPGSNHALVLPSTIRPAEDLATIGTRLTGQLEPFLDQTKYRAVAVVHGLSPTAASAFDLAKQQRTAKGGVVWVTDPDFLAHLSGPNATLLRKLLKPKDGFVLTFFSVKRKVVTGKLHWGQLRAAELDREYTEAASDGSGT